MAAAPQQPRGPRSTHMHPVVQGAVTAGLAMVSGSVVVGAVAYTTGRRQLYNSLTKFRMIVVATTFGIYASGSGWIPPPPIFTTIAGRQPRPPAIDPLFNLEQPPTPN